jgi:hypothetical protein
MKAEPLAFPEPPRDRLPEFSYSAPERRRAMG